MVIWYFVITDILQKCEVTILILYWFCRNIGLGSCAFWTRAGGVVAPQIMLLVSIHPAGDVTRVVVVPEDAMLKSRDSGNRWRG